MQAVIPAGAALALLASTVLPLALHADTVLLTNGDSPTVEITAEAADNVTARRSPGKGVPEYPGTA